jgi:predicted acylesterase/phospholipase RssA
LDDGLILPHSANPTGSNFRERQGIGLALSGGGFRATLFHIGSIWRLIELGVLPRVTRISSVSGGSIFSGVLASKWPALTRLVYRELPAAGRRSASSVINFRA